ncbi:MAG: hypothetical protein WDM89_10045 [Rhizomicrobium sp.]
MEAFDAFIVNYAWLSKALEFAPHGIFKILDTHDKVSDRKEVLASLGLGPEFFYTTKAEEAVALGRADLVWAIKDQEKALFEEMAKMPVLTLPHLDPPRDFERPAPVRMEFLRLASSARATTSTGSTSPNFCARHCRCSRPCSRP